MSDYYNVLIDFDVEGDCNPHDVLDHHIHTEDIGDGEYQVGLAVLARSDDRAYTRATNLLEAEIRAYTDCYAVVTEVHVYGPGRETKDSTIYS